MSPTILIVEDESEIADSVIFALKADGMTPLWAANGQQAIEALNDKPSLIILDVGLPDINGFELIKLIKQQLDVPVIFLTARSEEIDRIIGLEIGADDYVTKPFSPRELATRVKVILRRSSTTTESSTGNSAELENNDTTTLLINTQQQQAYFKTTALNLTRTEFILLSTLVSQPNRVFSRRQLIEAIWSDYHPSDDRVIDTHVKTLRAKIKQHDDENSYIVTHRGFGYSIQLHESPMQE